jgi:hypothetical protein
MVDGETAEPISLGGYKITLRMGFARTSGVGAVRHLTRDDEKWSTPD